MEACLLFCKLKTNPHRTENLTGSLLPHPAGSLHTAGSQLPEGEPDRCATESSLEELGEVRIAHSLHSPTHHLLFLIVAFFSITTQKLVISIFPVPEHTFLWSFLVPLSLLPYGTQDSMIPLLRFKTAWALPESQPARLLPFFPRHRHIPEQCLKSFRVLIT